jgi:hypothetical protein
MPEASNPANGQVIEAEFLVVDAAFDQIKVFGVSIQEQEAEPMWFSNLLICFLNSCLREYRHLKIGREKYTGLLAWACRNLLELNIFTQYALISEANARRFIGDRLIDGIGIFTSLKEWYLTFNPGAVTPELDETIRIAREQLLAEGIEAGRYLSTRDLAAAVGLENDYAHINRVCSKLVHPTAWSVLAMNDEGELGQLKPILFNTGARYGLEIGEKIRKHVEQNGLAPKHEPIRIGRLLSE